MTTRSKFVLASAVFHPEVGEFVVRDRYWSTAHNEWYYGADPQDDVFYPEHELVPVFTAG